MRQFRYRAKVSLDSAGPRRGTPHAPTRPYPSHTRALVALARPLRADCGPARFFPTEIWWDSGTPLHPGDQALVTIRVTDEHADDFFGCGQQFTLWSGGRVGIGIVYRRVFTDYSPS